MIYIKCSFPRNYYLLRKVNVRCNKQSIAAIGHNESIELPNQTGLYAFKLDYHKTNINISDASNDKYLILFFHYRKKFPFYFTDIMFKNALRVQSVDKETFNAFDETFYNEKNQEIISFNAWQQIVVAVYFIFSLFLIYTSIFNEQDNRGFIFVLGLLGLFSGIQTFVKRTKMPIRQFRIRYIASSLIMLCIGFFFSFALWVSILLILWGLLSLIIVINTK